MNTELKVVSVNISEEKGTVKVPVERIDLNDRGVITDAHAGSWHRQVSMLGVDSFEKFSALAGREISYGEFAENLTTEGVCLYKTKPLDRFVGENVELEVTQIGKKCHGDTCAIYKEVGNCVMPKEGIFCRVLKAGSLAAGDVLTYVPKVFRYAVITLSDRASSGEYTDRSGPRLQSLVDDYFNSMELRSEGTQIVIPDSAEQLERIITDTVNSGFDFIFTTGGTGVGPRDITPDVVSGLLDKEIPGIMEMIRLRYGAEKPNALLSRGVAGVRGKTQIYTLPGSVKAINEYMSEITKTMNHLVLMLHSIDAH